MNLVEVRLLEFVGPKSAAASLRPKVTLVLIHISLRVKRTAPKSAPSEHKRVIGKGGKGASSLALAKRLKTGGASSESPATASTLPLHRLSPSDA
jgi:hypothetical protein